MASDTVTVALYFEEGEGLQYSANNPKDSHNPTTSMDTKSQEILRRHPLETNEFYSTKHKSNKG